jgi:type IV pilus assembly protein PilQ
MMIINIETMQNIKKTKSGPRSSAALKLAVVFIAALLVGGFSGPAAAANGTADQTPVNSAPTIINSITIEDNAVNIKMQGPIKYSLQKTSDPFLVAVVIEGASVGQLSGKILSKSKGIIEVSPAQIEAPALAARLDILLQSKGEVRAEVSGDVLRISIVRSEAQPVEQAATVRKDQDQRDIKEVLTEKPAAGPAAEPVASSDGVAREITEIFFEKDKNMVELVIKADGKIGEPAVFQLDGSVIIEIPGVKSRAAVPSKMISPVKEISVKTESGKLRIVINAQSGAQSEVYILDDELLVDFALTGSGKKTVRESGVTDSGKIVDGGKVISLDFQDADIVPILRLLGDVSGYNMVVHPDVKGKITMKLMNVPWTQALDIITKTFNLEKVIEGNIIRIATVKAFQEEKKASAENKELFSKAEDIITKIFIVNNASVEKLKDTIEKGKLLSPRGTVSLDVRTRSLIVKDIQPILDEVQRLLSTLDKPTQQVMIEARIVEMQTSYSQSLGVEWGLTGKAKGVLGKGDSLNTTGSQGSSILSGQSAGSTLFNLPAATSSLGPQSAITFGYLTADKTLGLDLRLSAIETKGKVKILANPKVMTLDNQQAIIKQGKKIPIITEQTSGGVTTFTTVYIDANLKLTVTPQISPNGAVVMKVEIVKDQPDYTKTDEQGNPAIDTRFASTQVVLMDGETIVIGGIITTNDSVTNNMVPGVSKIPLLGELFKQETKEISNTELLIFLTPRLLQ